MNSRIMHVYIYDSFVNQKKYNNIIAKIETRITDLGLNGKIIRLGAMNSLYEAIQNEIKNNAKTITVVGNNNILNQGINAITKLTSLNLSTTIPLGFIPVGKKNNTIAKYLGIGFEENACNTLSARRIEKLDLGSVNDNYFLTQAVISTQETTVEIDKDYSIEIIKSGDIIIINLPTTDIPGEIKPNASDGVLELFIKTKKNNLLPFNNKISQSVIPFKNIKVINPKKTIIIDDTIEISTPALITLGKYKINLIVGKDRKF